MATIMTLDSVGNSRFATRIPDEDATPPALPDATSEINGNDGDPPTQRADTQTRDGKPVQQDPLYTSHGVEITRERTTNGVDRDGNVIVSSDQVVVETTGSGNDRVEVRSNPDGSTDLYVNGERFPTTLAPGQEITIRTGAGDDTIWVDSDIQVNVVVEAGDGDDFVMTGAGNDRIDAGAGNDTVYGGAGRDDLFGNSGDDHLSGGEGNDVVYGGDGADFMTGTTGDDYLEGGKGNDTVWGGAGNDILSGGRGNDTLEGDGGNDVVYTGLGTDTVENSGGSDRIYSQKDDRVTIGQYADTGTTANTVVNVVVTDVQSVTVDPGSSTAFQQRVQADIDMMNASPLGTQLFAQLDASGHSVVISETTDQNGYAGYSDPNARFATPTGPGAGTDVQIGYNPSFHGELDGTGYGFPVPAVTLYHELSHAWNGVTGTSQPGEHQGPGTDGPSVVVDPRTGQQVNVPGTNNRERQAVGLETNPPAGGANPEYATENGMREEMGLPDRPVYRN